MASLFIDRSGTSTTDPTVPFIPQDVKFRNVTATGTSSTFRYLKVENTGANSIIDITAQAGFVASLNFNTSQGAPAAALNCSADSFNLDARQLDASIDMGIYTNATNNVSIGTNHIRLRPGTGGTDPSFQFWNATNTTQLAGIRYDETADELVLSGVEAATDIVLAPTVGGTGNVQVRNRPLIVTNNHFIKMDYPQAYADGASPYNFTVNERTCILVANDVGVVNANAGFQITVTGAGAALGSFGNGHVGFASIMAQNGDAVGAVFSITGFDASSPDTHVISVVNVGGAASGASADVTILITMLA